MAGKHSSDKQTSVSDKGWQDFKILQKKLLHRRLDFNVGIVNVDSFERKIIMEFILQTITHPNFILCIKNIPKIHQGSNLF